MGFLIVRHLDYKSRIATYDNVPNTTNYESLPLLMHHAPIQCTHAVVKASASDSMLPARRKGTKMEPS